MFDDTEEDAPKKAIEDKEEDAPKNAIDTIDREAGIASESRGVEFGTPQVAATSGRGESDVEEAAIAAAAIPRDAAAAAAPWELGALLRAEQQAPWRRPGVVNTATDNPGSIVAPEYPIVRDAA